MSPRRRCRGGRKQLGEQCTGLDYQKRMRSLRKSLTGIDWSQNDNCQGAQSQRTEKMLQRMAVLQLILYIRIRGGGVRRAM